MHTPVRNLTPMSVHEFQDRANEEVIELYDEIRKRMPGVRVCGVSYSGNNATLYYPDERYARGVIGFEPNWLTNGNRSASFYIQGPFITNERGGGAPENCRMRSKSAATLARKAKKALRAYTTRDHANVYGMDASIFARKPTPAEAQEDAELKEANNLLSGRVYGGVELSAAFRKALATVTFPQEDIEHAKNLVLCSMAVETQQEVEARRVARRPYYVAVYERYGQPVYDLLPYGGSDEEDVRGAMQFNMPERLHMALATLNTLQVGGEVEGMGKKISDDEFIVLKGAFE